MSTADGTPLPRFRGGLGAAVATEGKMHLADGVGVKRMTRAMDVAGSVSRHPWSKLSVCGARYLFLGSVSHSM